MADTNETTADIIAEMRRGTKLPGCWHSCDVNKILQYHADRIEAAHKREVDVLKQRCAELNAEIAAKDEVIKRLNDAISEEQRRKMATAEKPSVVGDCAKLREALSDACYAMFNFLKTQYGGYEEMANALDKAKAALAAPPRNCDVYTTAEEARQARLNDAENWDEFGSPKLKLDEWLFAPATEKEGGAK